MRRYSEKEVREILRRASHAGAGKNQSRDGVTLAELERVAEEMGLPPDQVRDAALALDAEKQSRGPLLFSVPTLCEEERAMPAAIDEHAWKQIVARLSARYGVEGKASGVGTAFEWRNVQADGSKADAGETVFSAVPDGGGSRVRARTDLTQPKLMAFFLGTLTPAILIGVLGTRRAIDAHASQWIAPIIGAALLAPYAAMTAVMRAVFKHVTGQSKVALDEIAEFAPCLPAGEIQTTTIPAAEQDPLQNRLNG